MAMEVRNLIATAPLPAGGYGCGFTDCPASHPEEIDALVCARLRLAQIVRQLRGVRTEESARESAAIIDFCRRFDAERPDVVLKCAQVNAERMIDRLLEYEKAFGEAGVRLSRKQRQAVRRAYEALTGVVRGDLDDRAEPVRLFERAEAVFKGYAVRHGKARRR
jgi:hypothetical protein